MTRWADLGVIGKLRENAPGNEDLVNSYLRNLVEA